MLLPRILTAIVLIAVLVAALLAAPNWAWGLLCLVFMAAAAYEWGNLQRGGWAIPKPIVLSVGLFLAGLGFLLFDHLHLVMGASLTEGHFFNSTTLTDSVGVLVVAIAGMFWLFIAPSLLRPARQVRGLSSFVPMIILLAAWLSVTRLAEVGAAYVFSVLLIVWLADTGAYAAGRLLGRVKLAPSISPGKTWEGVAGGVLCVFVYFGLAHIYADRLPAPNFPDQLIQRVGWLPAFVIAAALSAYSVIGDLFESKLKREAGVKDSGKTLPGHGGVLDRIDALLPILPFCWLLHGLIIAK